MSEVKETVGERIKKRREELGFSQDDLAFKMGYSNRSSVAQIEAAGDKVSLSKVSKCAKALNVKESYLMGWDDVSPDILIENGNSSVVIPRKDFSILNTLETQTDKLDENARKAASAARAKLYYDRIKYLEESKDQDAVVNAIRYHAKSISELSHKLISDMTTTEESMVKSYRNAPSNIKEAVLSLLKPYYDKIDEDVDNED